MYAYVIYLQEPLKGPIKNILRLAAFPASCIYIYICRCACIYLYVHMCNHVYIYIYSIHIYVYSHTCIYTSITYMYAYIIYEGAAKGACKGRHH